MPASSVVILTISAVASTYIFAVILKYHSRSFLSPVAPRVVWSGNRKRLTSSFSTTNWSQGSFSLSVNRDGVSASVGDPAQAYYTYVSLQALPDIPRQRSYVTLVNRSLLLVASGTAEQIWYDFPPAASWQYLRLESDGHLRLYQWQGNGIDEWTAVLDL